MPWTDLQFWIVSILTMAALVQLVRPFLIQSDGPCSGCATGKAACRAPHLVERIGAPPWEESKPTTR